MARSAIDASAAARRHATGPTTSATPTTTSTVGSVVARYGASDGNRR
jgi:hypothetical protein